MSDSRPTARRHSAVGSATPTARNSPSDDDSKSSGFTDYQIHRRPASSSAHTDLPATAPPLPYDESPPLPEEEVPVENDWVYIQSDINKDWTFCQQKSTGRHWFYHTITNVWTEENPFETKGTGSSTGAHDPSSPIKPKRVAGGYNPAIHGHYDPKADYAIEARRDEEEAEAAIAAANAANAAAMTASLRNNDYTATGTFNRFTGRFQNDHLSSENHSNDAKSHRQMNAFFDVDKAANSHDGRSLKAERRNQHLSKAAVQKFKKIRKDKKEEKRRAWLME